MLLRVVALLCLCTIAASVQAAWEKVPPMDWAAIKPADFADNELDVPYYLEHFHTVANAVVEEGENRGFIDIAVNRRPQDNKPYNARIQENTAWFAYLYATNKPWNRYYAMPAVRQRLEAMLDFWCRVQSPEGYFSEYKPQGWNLAATGFGVLFMSQTLDQLKKPGAPPIDPAILERTMQAQRKAILAILTAEPLKKTATSYHNQYTGVYRAATRYLQLRPDPEILAAWREHTKWAAEKTQSPMGFFYEANYPDYGYSHVHDVNLQNAEPVLAQAPDFVRAKLIEEYRKYNLWLAPNFVLEPDHSTYFTNAGVQNRTQHSAQKFTQRPFASLVEESWPFSVTDAEAAAEIRERRTAMEKEWPKQPPLTSYSPRFAFVATDGLMKGFPTEAQRSAAIARLPYLAKKNYAQLRYDPRAIGVLYVRRPAYYAALNFGPSEGKVAPVMGLGLLWNDTAGTVAQALPETGNATWGVTLDGQEKQVETGTLRPVIMVGGKTVEPAAGIAELPIGEIVVTWPLGETGKKTVTFGPEEIRVEIEAKGGFTEQIPLVLRPGDTIESNDGAIIRTRGKQRFVIAAPGGRIELPSVPASATSVRRVKARIAGTDKLTYTLAFPK